MNKLLAIIAFSLICFNQIVYNEDLTKELEVLSKFYMSFYKQSNLKHKLDSLSKTDKYLLSKLLEHSIKKMKIEAKEDFVKIY